MNSIREELAKAGKLLDKKFSLMEQLDAIEYINSVIAKFNPEKTSGHLAINSEKSIRISTDLMEFEYSQYLDDEPVYLFFDQNSQENNTVVKIHDGQSLSGILEECFGMEYFLSNEKITYLISVNWYTIEVVGTACLNLSKYK